MVADKTGSLIATSGQFGALLAGAPAGSRPDRRGLGEKIGVAFQLSDDILDVACDSAQSGKTPGTDLREGVRTLPVLYALRSLGQSASAQPGSGRSGTGGASPGRGSPGRGSPRRTRGCARCSRTRT